MTINSRFIGVIGDSKCYQGGTGVTRIANPLKAKGWLQSDIRISGVGSRIPYGGTVLPTMETSWNTWQAEPFDPKVVVLITGGNIRTSSQSTWVAQFTNLFNLINASGRVIYGMNLAYQDVNDGVAFNNWYTTFLSAQGATLIDQYALMRSREQAGLTVSWATDGVHMEGGATGYDLINNLLANAVQSYAPSGAVDPGGPVDPNPPTPVTGRRLLQRWTRKDGVLTRPGRPDRAPAAPTKVVRVRRASATGVLPPEPENEVAWTPLELLTPQPRPVGSGYVRYEDIYVNNGIGDTLQQTSARVTAGTDGKPRVLTFPEGVFETSDFTVSEGSSIRLGSGGAVACRGYAGSGRNTIIRIKANTASRNRGNNIAGDIIKIAGISGAYFANFRLEGTPQNGLFYSGIVIQNCPDPIVEWMYLLGASPGYANAPPGETFGINMFRSPRATIRDTEVDGRQNGVRVSSTGIGWNTTTDAFVYRCYIHHGAWGMPTWWETTNIYTEDLWSISTASNGSSSALNHEQSQGRIRHIRPYLFKNGANATGTSTLPGIGNIGPRTATTGHHFSALNVDVDMGVDMQLVEPTWDANRGPTGMLIMDGNDGYKLNNRPDTSKLVTAPTVIKAARTLGNTNHPLSGWSSADAALFYAWVH